MKAKLLVGSLCSMLCLAVGGRAAQADASSDWRRLVADRLPLFGHRNWIVIADSAYPAQSSEGIEMIVSGAGQIEVLQYVLRSLAATKHIRPIVYLDRELQFVGEADAPGVQAYREQLPPLLPEQKPINLLHEELIGRLEKAAESFRVLLIKTNMTIPYTSVFLQLDCAYWDAEAERKLRAQMPQRTNH